MPEIYRENHKYYIQNFLKRKDFINENKDSYNKDRIIIALDS